MGVAVAWVANPGGLVHEPVGVSIRPVGRGVEVGLGVKVDPSVDEGMLVKVGRCLGPGMGVTVGRGVLIGSEVRVGGGTGEASFGWAGDCPGVRLQAARNDEMTNPDSRV